MFKKYISVAALAATACLGLSATQAAYAQAYPSQNITLLIPYPPGGSADIVARPLAAELQSRLGKTVIVDYKPGAGGTIASAQLARAKPDGYTLIMVLAAHAINHSLYPTLPYNTKTDFTPVSLVATLPLIVAAPLSTPANTIPELIKYAKANPGKLSFASAGNGNTSHLAGEMFKSATGVDMMHVPYKGSGPAVMGLLSGEVSLMFDSISTSLPQVQAGKLKALAVTGEKRSPLVPQVPTVAESGVPDFIVNGWYGILAPAKTPPEIVNTLSRAIADSIKQPKIQQQMAAHGYTLIGSSPKEFATHIDQEIARWSKIVVSSGAKIE
jgi:tripartite-type tricarboxylate transporter receptor subunit TctC